MGMPKYIWIRLLCFVFMLVFLQKNSFSSHKDFSSAEYLYYQPYFSEDVELILDKYRRGEFTQELSPHRFFPGTSVWIYLPSEMLLKDTSKNYLLTGYQDVVEVYAIKKQRAVHKAIAGKYLKKSEVNELTGRYFVRLFNQSSEIGEGYLIAYRKLHDTNHTPMQATLSNWKEVDDWQKEYYQSKYWMVILGQFSAGVLFFSIVFMLGRYIVTRELSNLYYMLWMIAFFLHFVLMYFQSVLNNDLAVLDSLRFNLVVSHTGILWAIPFLSLSFKYFHVVDDRTKRDFDLYIQPIINHVIKVCIAAAFIVIAVNYFTYLYALGSLIMQLMVGYIFVYIIMNEYLYRKKMSTPVTEAYAIIIIGGLVHILFFLFGYVLAVFDYLYQWNLGLEVTLTFAALLGFIVHNLIAFIAYNMRDNEILKERNLLHARSVEDEIKVIQNSLNPHFIFNSLELMDAQIVKGNVQDASKALMDFSDLLRMVINKSSDKLISLKEELKMVELYLNLEQQRNSGLEKYQIKIQDGMDVRFYRVPPLIIQPLVENAIKHGLRNRSEETGGEVIVSVGKTGNVITFEIEDNGIGCFQSVRLQKSDADKKHIGIESTQKRLAFLNGSEFQNEAFQMIDKSEISDEQGTIVRFKVKIF